MTRRHPSGRAFAIYLVAASLLGAVSGVASSGTASASSTPKQGGSLSENYPYAPSLGLSAADATGSEGGPGGSDFYLIYDALVALTPGGALQYRLATSITGTSGTVWTIHLRSGVKFSDGTPFNATAVEDQWNYDSNPANAAQALKDFSNIASTSVVSPLVVQIKLKTPNYQFTTFLASSPLIFIGSPTAEQSEGQAQFAKQPVGAGAYMVTSNTTTQTMFTRNPHYYGKTYLSSITVNYIALDAQSYNTLITGGLDIDYTSTITTAEQAKSAGYGDASEANPGAYIAVFNVSIPPFNNLEARQAVTYALDNKAMAESLFNDPSIGATGMLPKGAPFYDPKAPQLSNPAKAQALFNKLAAAGTPLSFTISAPSGTVFAALATWMDARLSSFSNVTVTLDIEPLAQLAPKYLKATYQFDAISEVIASSLSSLATSFVPGGAGDLDGFSDPKITAAITAGESTPNAKAFKADFDTVQTQVAKDLPVFFMINTGNNFLYNKKSVGGLTDAALLAPGGGVIDFTKIWKQ